MSRTILAFAVAPLVSGFAILRDAGPTIAFTYAYVLSYLFGVPLFLLLFRTNRESHFRYALGGGLAASFLWFAIFAASGSLEPRAYLLVALFFLIGAIQGLVFRVIRGQGRASVA